MSKTKSTANDAQLKARRTNLEKKTYDELINIILRKDSTERKNNSKIQELTALLKEADELNESKATRILGFEKDMEGMKDLVKAKQENIDKLISDNLQLNEMVVDYNKIKANSRIKNTIIYSCFGIIAILILFLAF